MKKSEKPTFQNVVLTKWPEIQVKGKKVTPEQANRIIFTSIGCEPHLYSNDNQFEAMIKGITIDNFDFAIFKDTEKGKEFIKENPHMEHFYGFEYLDLSYKIASCYIGGNVAWMDWDGTIEYYGHNIGKWPSVGDVLNELTMFAYLFPFLDMSVQLMSGENVEDETYPVIEYTVKNGKVTYDVEPSGKLFSQKRDDDDLDEKILRGKGHIPYAEFIKRKNDFEKNLSGKLEALLNEDSLA